MPSRLTAEAPNRAERARLLAEVAARGFMDDYSGVRIARNGQRFLIEQATVWNLSDTEGQPCGQAATFQAWRWLENEELLMVQRIVSGGQTGADRAALDVALALGLPVGGWCPKGRRAEDGKIPDCYPLVETSERNYQIRTRRNIEESDGTLILNLGKLDGGTALTVAHARQIGKPCLVVALEDGIEPAAFRDWLAANHIQVLNIADPRESKRPGVYAAAVRCLETSLREGSPG